MEPFLGELRVFAFSKIPKGWLACEGQVLNISKYQALYSLLSTQFGGDGKATFQIPDLRGRVMLHSGTGASKTFYKQGSEAGTETVRLVDANVPGHQHRFNVHDGAASVSLSTTTAGESLATKPHIAALPNASINVFVAPSIAGKAVVQLNPKSIQYAGGNAGHENRMPYLTAQVCICIDGSYPPRP